jgi:hypothetical protein
VPLAYQLDPASRIVTITGDYAAAAEWKDLLAQVASDPHYERGFNFVRDLRVSAHPVDAQTVTGILAVVKQAWDALGVHRAAIVTRRGIDLPASVAHALAEMDGIPLRAFSSYDDAVKWLKES